VNRFASFSSAHKIFQGGSSERDAVFQKSRATNAVKKSIGSRRCRRRPAGGADQAKTRLAEAPPHTELPRPDPVAGVPFAQGTYRRAACACGIA